MSDGNNAGDQQSQVDQVDGPQSAAEPAERAAAGGLFVGQWNRLISTTNWEKGRIICQWREAMSADEAPTTAYSDEAWAQLVGGVTSQHVGRLRRVFQRFGDVYDQYEGLYWSHFQAAIDWDDAEMWLEGAISNGFSVSQMRGKRWETLGKIGDPPPESEGEDSNIAAGLDSPPDETGDSLTVEPTSAEQAVVRSPSADESKSRGDEDNSLATTTEVDDADDGGTSAPVARRQPLSVQVDELPDDLADAFEQFKLAIIAHRRANWTKTSPDDVIECLEALRDLALADPD